jgi:hypothetical protein
MQDFRLVESEDGPPDPARDPEVRAGRHVGDPRAAPRLDAGLRKYVGVTEIPRVPQRLGIGDPEHRRRAC